MISDEYPTSFTVETNVVMLSFFILRTCTREREVNGEALERCYGNPCSVVPCRRFGLLGTNAGGALIKDWIFMRKSRNTFDVFVRLVQIIVTGVTKPLVP